MKMAQIAAVFTPGAPVDRYDLFAGRVGQLMDVMNAVSQRGQHAVLYGERGVGKTSLANVIEEVFTANPSMNLDFWRVNCSTDDTFETIWSRLIGEHTDETLYGGTIPVPDKIRILLQRREQTPVIVIDELDRVEDEDTMRQMADTVKALSDHSVPATVVFVGVADSIDELIEEHASVERALVQIHMPRMSPHELIEAIEKRLEQVDMTMETAAKRRIAGLSEGLPHYTHLLALYASQEAVKQNRNEVATADVNTAVHMAVEKAQQSIRSTYLKAIGSPRKDNLFPHVLLACALAPKNELGYFRQSDVKGPMTWIRAKETEISVFAQHMDEFSQETRASVLEKVGRPRHWTFRFSNPLLQPYVILRGLSTEISGAGTNLITEGVLTELRSEFG